MNTQMVPYKSREIAVRPLLGARLTAKYLILRYARSVRDMFRPESLDEDAIDNELRRAAYERREVEIANLSAALVKCKKETKKAIRMGRGQISVELGGSSGMANTFTDLLMQEATRLLPLKEPWAYESNSRRVVVFVVDVKKLKTMLEDM